MAWLGGAVRWREESRNQIWAGMLMVRAFACLTVIPAAHTEMTSVLYGSGLNYQAGNPVRSEIRQLDRKIEELRAIVTSLGAGAAAASVAVAAPTPAIAAEVDARLTTISGDVDALRAGLTGLTGRVDSVGELSMRVQRMESSQVGSSGMLMEMRSLVDKLSSRLDALERSAAAAAAAAPVA